MLWYEIQMEGSKWISTAESVEQTLIMPLVYHVYGCSNQSSREIQQEFLSSAQDCCSQN